MAWIDLVVANTCDAAPLVGPAALDLRSIYAFRTVIKVRSFVIDTYGDTNHQNARCRTYRFGSAAAPRITFRYQAAPTRRSVSALGDQASEAASASPTKIKAGADARPRQWSAASAARVMP